MCNIIRENDQVKVFANNGEPSMLFESLLKIPYINENQAVSIYIQATSQEFLDNNLVLDENYEPKVFFAESNGTVDTLHESIDYAKSKSINGQVKIVFAREESTYELNSGLYSEKTIQLGLINNKPETKNDAISRINNLILGGIISADAVPIIMNDKTTQMDKNVLRETNEMSLLDYFRSSPNAIGDYLIMTREVNVECN